MITTMNIDATESLSLWRLFERVFSSAVYASYFGFLGYLVFDSAGVVYGVALGLILYLCWGGVQRHVMNRFRKWYVDKSEEISRAIEGGSDPDGRIHHGIIALAVFIYFAFLIVDFLVWCYALTTTAIISFANEADSFIAKVSGFSDLSSSIITIFDSFSIYRSHLRGVGDFDRLALIDFVAPTLLIATGYFSCRFIYAWINETILFNKHVHNVLQIKESNKILLRKVFLLGSVLLVFHFGSFFDLSSNSADIWVLRTDGPELIGLSFNRIHGIERYVFDVSQWLSLGVFGFCCVGYAIAAWIGERSLHRPNDARETNS